MMPKLSGIALLALTSSAFWHTHDQLGYRAFGQAEYQEAADYFENPMWKGTALYRAGEFKAAQQAFARVDTAEAHYNRGNCLVFMGEYGQAAESFDRALSRRPDWKEAEENRDLAIARAEMLKREGGDMGDQTLGADEIVFDKAKEGGQETTMEDETSVDPKSMQALWLRRVQTRPADFLKSKFAYQQKFGEEEK